MRECKEKFGLDEAEFKKHFMDIEEPFMLGDMSCKEFWHIVCDEDKISFEQFADVFANAYEINQDMINLIRSLKEKYLIVMLSDSFDCLAESVKSNPMLEGI